MFYSMKTVLVVVGLALGTVLCALGLSGLMLLWNRHQRNFDERQVLHRGRAATLGCVTAVAYCVALMCWDGFADWPVDLIGQMGIWLVLMVVLTYCILTESLIRPRNKYGAYGLSLVFVGVVEIVDFYHKNRELSWLVEKGMEVAVQHEHFLGLFFGVNVIFLGILIMATQWHYSRE